MRKTVLAASFATVALAAPGLASAQAKPEASPHTVSGNLAIVSDYRFRGIAQTFKQPAIQGGIDYSHASGFYAGNWNSSINSGAGFPGGSIEMDLYGGWKKTWGDWGLDVGLIHYMYPGTDATAANYPANPRTGETHTGRVSNTELYIGGSWKWLSLKYYHATSDYFSLPGTNGSNYLDLSASYDVGNGWNIVGHVGSFRLKGWHVGTDLTKGSYTDWKLGVTKDINGWVFGAAYVDSSAKGSCDPANTGFYCFGNSASGATKFKNAGNGTVVLSVSKTF